MYKTIIASLCIIVAGIFDIQAQTIYKSQPRNNNTINKYDNSGRDYSKFSTDNIIYSGNLGLNFMNNGLSFGLGPIFGYKFNDYLSSGIRLGYNYFRQKDYNYFVDHDGNILWKPLRNDYYQAGIWARFSPIDMLYAHVEYEQHHIVQKSYIHDATNIFKKHKENFNINALMVGLGYKQMMTDRLSYCYTILYDVLQNTEKNSITDPTTGKKYSLSPYANTIDIRIGIFYNF